MTLIPLILWLIAAACCIAIIILARHYAGTKEEPKPVAKSAIALHVVSLVLAMAPYVAFIIYRHDISAAMRTWYTKVGWVSGAVLVALIAWDLWAMYRIASKAAEDQARRAKQHAEQYADAQPSSQPSSQPAGGENPGRSQSL